MSGLSPSEAREMTRVAELKAYGILDTPNEPEFDALVRTTARMFDVPIALISLVDTDRSWFKARHGLESRETPSAISFCTHAIQGPDVYVVPDAASDKRFANNALVTGNPNIRFYAGAPLKTPTGKRIGSICIIDTKPRDDLSNAEKTSLEDMAAEVMRAVNARQLRRINRLDRMQK